MNITNSNDISLLQVQVTFDISEATPIVSLVNLSAGNNLGNISWAFVVTSPSTTLIHNGNINSPDIVGNWNTHTISDAWPRPFNQIEWSGAPYSFYVIAKDSVGNIYTSVSQTAFICRPSGNLPTSKNTYGVASSDVKVKCTEARIYFQDTTLHSYKGLEGTHISSNLRVLYPMDETGNLPAPFSIGNYSVALVPISYSSSNYQFFQTDIYSYDLGNYTFVKIKYQTIQTFSVWCNIDLLPLVCEINKLIDSIEHGTCSDVEDAKQKMNLIFGKLSLVVIGIQQPLTGVDVPALIEDIKLIGGFDCNCCSAASGIIPSTASIIDGYSFSVNKLGGDVNGSFSVTGNNIVLNIGDVSYIVKVCQSSPSEVSAFSFIPSTSGDGFTKTYCLKIDGTQLGFDILNIIKNNSALVNLFNQIVNVNTADFKLEVDGGCIFSSVSSCNYTFSLANIPASVTFASLTSIKIGNISHPLSFLFNLTNLTSLQTYLNGLGFGSFIVTDLGGGNISIVSNANTNELIALMYKVSTTNYSASLSRVCIGYMPLSANEVVQNIIDYLCSLTDTKVFTSQDYEICFIDKVNKIKRVEVVSGGESLNSLIIEILDRGCDTIEYIASLSSLNCDNVKALFPFDSNPMQANDFLLGTKIGKCARIYPVELGTKILEFGIYNTDFMTAFCNAVTLCAAGLICEAYSIFEVDVVQNSPVDNNIDLLIKFTHPSAVSNTIRYARIDNTFSPIYTTITGILPGASPYTINNVADGQYIVGITPIYADGRKCSEVTLTTPACSGINSFSAVLFVGGSPVTNEILINYSAIVSVPYVRVNINYPNGGVFSQTYVNNGAAIIITPPVLLYGDYYITMTPVCNLATGFFGAPTAPAIVNIPEPPLCSCPTGFLASPDNSFCFKNETTPPTIVGSSVCVANANKLLVYASLGTRIYNTGYNTILAPAPAPGDILTTLNNAPQWNSSTATNGPTNRFSVWVDSDCNGVVDPLTPGAQVTLSYVYNNPGPSRTIYVGLGGDNEFQFKLNGLTLAETIDGLGTGWYWWHIIPVVIRNGTNYFNMVGTGDGTVNDMISMAVYDNTSAQLIAATDDSQLSFLYKSSDSIGLPINVATCPDGWSLDTTGGVGNFICRKTTTASCI